MASKSDRLLERVLNQLSKARPPTIFDIYLSGSNSYLDFKKRAVDELLHYKYPWQQSVAAYSNPKKKIIDFAIRRTCKGKGKEGKGIKCSRVLKKAAKLEAKYPSLDSQDIFEGNGNFKALSDITSKSSYYRWRKDYKELKDEIMDLFSITHFTHKN